jgi:hypothetical protein
MHLAVDFFASKALFHASEETGEATHGEQCPQADLRAQQFCLLGSGDPRLASNSNAYDNSFDRQRTNAPWHIPS